MTDPIVIRTSTVGDADAIRALAELDSAQVPQGPAILAFVGGELRAALPLSGKAPIADPFTPTQELVDLLRAYTARPRSRFRDRLALPMLRARTA